MAEVILEPGSKVCFVTTGATAPFIALIEAVLKPGSIDALKDAGYTHLLVQYGTAKSVFDERVYDARMRYRSEADQGTLHIDGFDFDSNALKGQFKLVQDSNGLVISHAGSGTILEALRHGVPLIVVPNTALLDNHQDELAIAMEKSGYLIKGDIIQLSHSIKKVEGFKKRMTQFPPVTSGKHRETKSFAAIMDETMGLLD